MCSPNEKMQPWKKQISGDAQQVIRHEKATYQTDGSIRKERGRRRDRFLPRRILLAATLAKKYPAFTGLATHVDLLPEAMAGGSLHYSGTLWVATRHMTNPGWARRAGATGPVYAVQDCFESAIARSRAIALAS